MLDSERERKGKKCINATSSALTHHSDLCGIVIQLFHHEICKLNSQLFTCVLLLIVLRNVKGKRMRGEAS